MRKIILLLALLVVSQYAFSGTCTTISRSDFVDGNILSASDLNTQFGSAYSAINAADGGCISDGTLELGALSSSDFTVQTKGIKRGCNVEYVATSSFYIDSCFATVNGLNVDKTATTSVTYSNLDTGSMATGTTYYIYITSGSTGTTLTPKISTATPDGKGYNVSNDLAIARFTTGTSSTNIKEGSIYQYNGGSFGHARRVVEYFSVDPNGNITYSNGGFLGSCTKNATGDFNCFSVSNYVENDSTGLIPIAHCWSHGSSSIVSATSMTGITSYASGTVNYYVKNRDSTDGSPANVSFDLFCSLELKR